MENLIELQEYDLEHLGFYNIVESEAKYLDIETNSDDFTIPSVLEFGEQDFAFGSAVDIECPVLDSIILGDSISSESKISNAIDYLEPISETNPGANDKITNNSHSEFKSPKVSKSTDNNGPGNAVYECTFCTKIFSSKANLTFHIRAHTGDRPFGCTFCDKTFGRRDSLIIHESIHTGNKPFKCEICSKCFPSNAVLNKHKKGTHAEEKGYECEVCKKCFTSKGNLTKHAVIHTGIKPFSCPFCTSSFVSKGDLEGHLRFHFGIKPFECTHCEKKFSYKGHLKKHLELHLDERPLKCQYCSREFKFKGPYKKHIKAHTFVQSLT